MIGVVSQPTGFGRGSVCRSSLKIASNIEVHVHHIRKLAVMRSPTSCHEVFQNRCVRLLRHRLVGQPILPLQLA